MINYKKATYSRTTKPRKDNLNSIQRSQTVQRELQKDQKKIFSWLFSIQIIFDLDFKLKQQEDLGRANLIEETSALKRLN